MSLKRIAVEIDDAGAVLGGRALQDEENPGPWEHEYVPASSLREARLYAEKMRRDRDPQVQRCGADLLQIVDAAVEER